MKTFEEFSKNIIEEVTYSIPKNIIDNDFKNLKSLVDSMYTSLISGGSFKMKAFNSIESYISSIKSNVKSGTV